VTFRWIGTLADPCTFILRENGESFKNGLNLDCLWEILKTLVLNPDYDWFIRRLTYAGSGVRLSRGTQNREIPQRNAVCARRKHLAPELNRYGLACILPR